MLQIATVGGRKPTPSSVVQKWHLQPRSWRERTGFSRLNCIIKTRRSEAFRGCIVAVDGMAVANGALVDSEIGIPQCGVAMPHQS